MERQIGPFCPEKNETSEGNTFERATWLCHALHVEGGWGGSRASIHGCHSADRTGLYRRLSICSKSLRHGLPHMCDSQSGWEIPLHAEGHGIPKAASRLGHIPQL